jgi:dihydrofolate reductase
MGGGELFRKLLDLGEVDSLNVTVVPILLGDGTPLMPPPYAPTKVALTAHRVYKSGIISMTYELIPQGQSTNQPAQRSVAHLRTLHAHHSKSLTS